MGEATRFTSGGLSKSKIREAAGHARHDHRARGEILSLLPSKFLVAAALTFAIVGTTTARTPSDPAYRNTQPGAARIGSAACAECHASIARSFRQTDMGRSLEPASAPDQLARVPHPITVFDRAVNRYYQIFRKGSNLYQAGYALDRSGKEIYRKTEELAYAVGAGENGYSYIIRRGDYLFQAPLSFYSKSGAWDLSPGHELGFDRPITSGCAACHSGRPNPVPDREARYSRPEFQELAIGCENCHGPGALHLAERRQNKPIPSGGDDSIVNPAALPGWLADNLCMSCHEQGDAQVLQPGQTYLDFHPGTPLAETVAIFKVPEEDRANGKGAPLQHWTLMIASRCYRASGGRLSCLTCHDPHVQPSPAQAPAYYRAKCLTCHTVQSCKLTLAERRESAPPDNCIGCHMPKQPLGLIAHSALTNHRIIRNADEPFPKGVLDKQAAGPDGLIDLDAPQDGSPHPPSPLTLLTAYEQLLGTHPEYQSRFDALLDRAAKEQPENPRVLAMLARRKLETQGPDAAPEVIALLSRAIARGSTWPPDYLLLGDLLERLDHPAQAAKVLQAGLELDPYASSFYELLAQADELTGDRKQERAILQVGSQRFPEDAWIRERLKKLEPHSRQRRN
jgi:Doubled CXXCH motif (Paired_CXXCH_1)